MTTNQIYKLIEERYTNPRVFGEFALKMKNPNGIQSKVKTTADRFKYLNKFFKPLGKRIELVDLEPKKDGKEN